MINYSLLTTFLFVCFATTLSAQPAKFDPFVGTIYDLVDYDVTRGYRPGVQVYDVLGKITLPELAVQESNQFARYFPGVNVRDMYGILFASTLIVSEPGCYEFYLESDDGSILWIEDNLVIDNDSLHKMTLVRDTLPLQAGSYPVKVWYYNGLPARFGLILKVNQITDSTACSNVKQQFVLDDILFDFNSHALLPEGQAALDNFCRLLKAMYITKIRLVGHTDNVGTSASNKTLSLQRAKAVKEYIKSKLNADIVMEAEGMGYTAPITRDTDAASQKRNRRVEVFID